MDELAVTFWPQLVCAITCLIFIETTHTSWLNLKELSILCWVLMAVNGFLIIGCQITRFVALKYESASSLQKMAFLTAIYAFIADIALFNVTFTRL